MYDPSGVKTSPDFLIPAQMKAWVLGGPDELLLRDKPTPVPGRAEVLVRIDAVCNLRNRPRNHPWRLAGQYRGWPALQQEFYARP